MENDRQPTAWEETTGLVAQPAPRSLSSLAEVRDTTPADRGRFAAELTPCLALVGAVGMTDHDRSEWLEAAWKALRGIPAGLLKRGARRAMVTADHPSKVVPAIMDEIGAAWRKRVELSQPLAIALPTPAPVIDAAERIEVAALMADLAKRMTAKHF